MYELFNIIERHGIVRSQDLMKISTLPAKKIEKLHHDLFNYIYDEQNMRIWGDSLPPRIRFHFTPALRSGALRAVAHLSAWGISSS